MEKQAKCPWCGHEKCPQCQSKWPELHDGCLPVQGQDHTDVRAYKGFGLNVQITRLGCRRSTSAFSSYTPQCETFARTIQGDHRKLAQMVVMWDGDSPTYVEILRKAFPVVSAQDLSHLYVQSSTGGGVPLSSFTKPDC